MIKIQNFCEKIDKKVFEKMNFLQMLIDAKCCNQEATDVSQLKKKEKDRYFQLIESYKYQEYTNNWHHVVNKYVDYKDI